MRAHWISTVEVAFSALTTNRVRSALTMLGIVIGVAAVIATVAVGSGASQRVQSQIASIGSNIVIIIPGSLTSSGLQLGTGSATTLTSADTREISAQCPDIIHAAPAVRGAASVIYEGTKLGNDDSRHDSRVLHDSRNRGCERRGLQSARCRQV